MRERFYEQLPLFEPFHGRRKILRICLGVTLVVFAGCAQTPNYMIGGGISGLSGTGLVLQDNGGDSLAVDANGPFCV